MASIPPFPLVRLRVMGYCKEFCIHWASTALNNTQNKDFVNSINIEIALLNLFYNI